VVRAILHVMPEQSINAGDPYELNNIRMLEAAERFGPERVDFICLWKGASFNMSAVKAAIDKSIAERALGK
jgi:hypothetical protein